jgi:hypothetical protein
MAFAAFIELFWELTTKKQFFVSEPALSHNLQMEYYETRYICQIELRGVGLQPHCQQAGP